jgi:hypothetical protein
MLGLVYPEKSSDNATPRNASSMEEYGLQIKLLVRKFGVPKCLK